MAEENNSKEKVELKLKFTPLNKKTPPLPAKPEPVPEPVEPPLPEPETGDATGADDSANASDHLRTPADESPRPAAKKEDFDEIKINLPPPPRHTAATQELTPDGKLKKPVDMSSKTVPHLNHAGMTESEKTYRIHVLKSWLLLIMIPLLLCVIVAIYLFVLILINPQHSYTVKETLQHIAEGNISTATLERLFVPRPAPAAEEPPADEEPVEYDSRYQSAPDETETSDTSTPAPAPSRRSGGYGTHGGGSNNPYNVSRHRERINRINNQHNQKYEEGTRGSGRRKK